jgi:hypothetical protein
VIESHLKATDPGAEHVVLTGARHFAAVSGYQVHAPLGSQAATSPRRTAHQNAQLGLKFEPKALMDGPAGVGCRCYGATGYKGHALPFAHFDV